MSTLQKFVAHLSSSDQRWDSIRRIPYSTPGRWVQVLDLSEIVPAHSTEMLSVDSNLTRLFPLLPFLASLYLVPEMLISNRVLTALQCKDGIGELRSLKGVKLSVPVGNTSAQPLSPSPDAVIRLLGNCPRLEQLEIACTDANIPEPEPVIDLDLSSVRDGAGVTLLPPPLHLPNLKSLCISAVPIDPLFLTFLRTPLPALRHLVLAPRSDRPTAQLSALLAAHGRSLISLRINTPRYLSPPMGDARPPPLLTCCPELHYLALDQQLLPVLTLLEPGQDGGSGGGSGSPHPEPPHPLRVLTIPRPNARFLRELEALLPRLPSLTAVRARAVRWLRAGVSGKALEAGVQGEMHEWRRRFARRGVRVVDGDWRDPW